MIVGHDGDAAAPGLKERGAADGDGGERCGDS